jgi:hypothetical protein
MTEKQRVRIKRAVDVYGRRKVALAVGMGYSILSQKLNGYATLHDQDVAKIGKVLGKEFGNG